MLLQDAFKELLFEKSMEKETMNEKNKKIEINEIATIQKDHDLFVGYLDYLENPDPVLLSQGNGRGIRLYDEVARDAQAGSVLDTRYLSVAGKEWEVTPGADKKENRTVAKFVKDTLLNCNFSTACREILQAILYGYYVLEIMWEHTERGIEINKFIGKHPRRFVFSTDRDLRLLTPENMVDGDPVPDRKFIRFTFGSSDNPYGAGIGQSLWFPVWFKKHGVKFWMIFLDKFGSPTTVGKYPPGTVKEQKDQLLDAIDTIQQETGLIIPQNMAVELLEAARSGSPGYEKMCEYMDRQMSKRVLGQNLTTEVSQGSRAASQTHDEVRHDIMKADADMLCECLNDTVIKWLVDYNFPNVSEYPKLWIRTDKDADLVDLSGRDKTLVRDIGLPVAKDYFYTTYQIPPPADGAELVGRGYAPADNPAGRSAAPADNPNRSENKDFSEPDLVPGDLAVASQKAMDSLLTPIMAELMAAESYEDMKEMLYSMYPGMNAGRFQQLIGRAMVATAVEGYQDAK
jgi:phage gp29-like protein